MKTIMTGHTNIYTIFIIDKYTYLQKLNNQIETLK